MAIHFKFVKEMNSKSYVFGNEDEGQNFTETYNIGEDFLITQTKT